MVTLGTVDGSEVGRIEGSSVETELGEVIVGNILGANNGKKDGAFTGGGVGTLDGSSDGVELGGVR